MNVVAFNQIRSNKVLIWLDSTNKINQVLKILIYLLNTIVVKKVQISKKSTNLTKNIIII